MNKGILAVLIIITFSMFSLGGNKPTTVITKTDSLKLSLTLNELDRIEKLFLRREPSWFNTYGTMIVAVVALMGTVATSIITNRRSKINTELQLKASQENITKQLESSHANLMEQIGSSKEIELEKKKLELKYKLKIEIKESVAKFINKATMLNVKLTEMLDVYDNMGAEHAMSSYNETRLLRQELLEVFYSIKVTLDASQKQRELETILGSYIVVTCKDFDVTKVKSEEYERPIEELYNKIRSIIHDN